MIIHDYKSIFIHVSKTGGSSIEHAFNPNIQLDKKNAGAKKGNTSFKGKHFPARRYKLEYPDIFDSYFKFAFVRNPWDRLVSNWFWLRYLNLTPPKESFYEWLQTVVHRKNYTYKTMLTINDEIAVDFVGKFESLGSDFQNVCEQIGATKIDLPHKNNLSDREHYSYFYNEEAKKLVEKHFAWEIETFKYEFEEQK